VYRQLGKKPVDLSVYLLECSQRFQNFIKPIISIVQLHMYPCEEKTKKKKKAKKKLTAGDIVWDDVTSEKCM
jgi:hypothetical protein